MLDFVSDLMEGVDIFGFPASIGPFPAHATSLVQVIIEPSSTTTTVSSSILRSSLPSFSGSLVPFLPTTYSFGAGLVENFGSSALTEFLLHSYPLSSWEDSMRAKVLLEMGSLYNGELGFYSCGDIIFFECTV